MSSILYGSVSRRDWKYDAASSNSAEEHQSFIFPIFSREFRRLTSDVVVDERPQALDNGALAKKVREPVERRLEGRVRGVNFERGVNVEEGRGEGRREELHDAVELCVATSHEHSPACEGSPRPRTSSEPSRQVVSLSQALQLYGTSLTDSSRSSIAFSRMSSTGNADPCGENGEGLSGGRLRMSSAFLYLKVQRITRLIKAGTHRKRSQPSRSTKPGPHESMSARISVE